MPAPLISPKFFWVTTAGLPAVGYQLFSYIAGTTTPQATYPTQVDAAALTNANANPTILDASGSANVWLPNNLTYKFILKDASNNTIWTVDNVNEGGVNTGAKTNLSVFYSHNTDVLATTVEQALSTTNGFSITNNIDTQTEFTATNGRWTCKTAGNYLVMAQASFVTTGVTFSGNALVDIFVNGSATSFNIPAGNQSSLIAGSSALTTAIPIWGILSVSANSFIDVRVKTTFSAGTPVFNTGQLMIIGL